MDIKLDRLKNVLRRDDESFSDELDDIQIRVKDIQDRTYDILNKHKRIIEENEIVSNDIRIRVRDIQDRVHDALWHQKSSGYQRDLMYWRLYGSDKEDLDETKIRFFRSLPKASGYNRKIQLLMLKLLQIIHDTCVSNGISYWLDFGTLLGAIRHKGFIPWDDDIDIGLMRKDAERLIKILRNDKRLFVLDRFNYGPLNGLFHALRIRWADTTLGAFDAYIDLFLYDYCSNGKPDVWNLFLEKRSAFTKKVYADFNKMSFKKSLAPEMQKELEKYLFSYHSSLRQEFNISDTENDFIIWGFDNFDYSTYKGTNDMHLYPKSVFFPLKTLEFEGFSFYAPNEYSEYIKMYGDIFRLPSDILSHKHVKYGDKELKMIDELCGLYL